MPVKAILLLSGGMDSAVAMAVARQAGRQLHALAIDYGQGHRRELLQARWQAKAQKAAGFTLFKLPLGRLASGALFGGPLRRSGLAPGKPGTYVSFRNGVLLALAAAQAEALGADEVWGGWCKADLGGYPDCSLPFFRAFERSVRQGTWAGRRGRRFKIQAPLARLSKAGIVRLGSSLGVDFSHTWTCYRPIKARPCRRCDACRLRAQAYAGQADPLLRKGP